MRGVRWVLFILALVAFTPMTFAGKPSPPSGPEPDWSIVFLKAAGAGSQLVLTVPDGSAQKVLHFSRGVNYAGPSFTPDGRHVVFTSDLGGVAGIYGIRLKDGQGQPSIGTPTLLTTVTPWSRSCHPTVSPEMVLAFSDDPEGVTKGDLYAMGVIVDAAGDLRPDPLLPRRNLTNTPDLYEVSPSWSIADPPSARRLAFTRFSSFATLTCNRMDCTGPTEFVLSGGPNARVSNAIGWSKVTPGLVAFGYVISGTGTSPDLYFMNLDAPEFQGRLTDTPELGAAENNPSWSPVSDNELIAFAQRRQDGIVLFKDIIARMAGEPTGAEATVAMPSRNTISFEEPDWRR